jgi:hypothetical protein
MPTAMSIALTMPGMSRGVFAERGGAADRLVDEPRAHVKLTR